MQDEITEIMNSGWKKKMNDNYICDDPHQTFSHQPKQLWKTSDHFEGNFFKNN